VRPLGQRGRGADRGDLTSAAPSSAVRSGPVRARAVGPVALAIAVVATAVAIPLRDPYHSTLRLACVVVAYAGFAVLLLAHRARPFLTRRLVLGSVVALLVVAVIAPPRASRDVWSYAMYGRIVSVHHESPYRVAPADVAPDPMLGQVSQ